MVTTSGNLFHIDFGHFLGNIKYCMVGPQFFQSHSHTGDKLGMRPVILYKHMMSQNPWIPACMILNCWSDLAVPYFAPMNCKQAASVQQPLLFTVQGFKREWAPFVLTPDFVYVMGGEGSDSFETYKNLCCRAFLILRRYAELIINLFSMVGTSCQPSLGYNLR